MPQGLYIHLHLRSRIPSWPHVVDRQPPSFNHRSFLSALLRSLSHLVQHFIYSIHVHSFIINPHPPQVDDNVWYCLLPARRITPALDTRSCTCPVGYEDQYVAHPLLPILCSLTSLIQRATVVCRMSMALRIALLSTATSSQRRRRSYVKDTIKVQATTREPRSNLARINLISRRRWRPIMVAVCKLV
jgi:hypothetical protein